MPPRMRVTHRDDTVIAKLKSLSLRDRVRLNGRLEKANDEKDPLADDQASEVTITPSEFELLKEPTFWENFKSVASNALAITLAPFHAERSKKRKDNDEATVDRPSKKKKARLAPPVPFVPGAVEPISIPPIFVKTDFYHPLPFTWFSTEALRHINSPATRLPAPVVSKVDEKTGKALQWIYDVEKIVKSKDHTILQKGDICTDLAQFMDCQANFRTYMNMLETEDNEGAEYPRDDETMFWDSHFGNYLDRHDKHQHFDKWMIKDAELRLEHS